ncbi:MAG: cytochrome c-type biogenesis protein CcmH [Candidatus Puniceispirillaceae bacterium]
MMVKGNIIARWCIIISLALAISTPVAAISPEEQLSDPQLEQRARDLSAQLRCLVCQNQSIDDSDADLAVDLRRQVRELLVAGDDDDAILDALRQRYGDYILLNPPVTTQTYALWATPFIIIAFGLILLVIYRRQNNDDNDDDSGLSDETASQIPAITDDDNNDEAQFVSKKTAQISQLYLVGGVAAIIAVSFVIYSQLGSPDLTAQPLAQRQVEKENAAAEIARQQTQDKARLTQAIQAASDNPSSVEAQLSLAMAAASANEFEIEQQALTKALALTDNNLAIRSMMAEALARQADGLVTLPARTIIQDILTQDPQEPRALYLLGLAAYQDEQFEQAITIWQQVLAVSNADAPWVSLVRQNIQFAADKAGIAIADMPALDEGIIADASDLSQDEQDEMIAAMIGQLEDRLKDNPDDLAGWQRLIRAKQVLGDEVGFIKALIGAAQADSQSIKSQLAPLEQILASGRGADFLPEAARILERIASLDPERLEYLFFAGHFAKLAGDNKTAINFWNNLLEKLPDDAPIIEELTSQIESLQTQP